MGNVNITGSEGDIKISRACKPMKMQQVIIKGKIGCVVLVTFVLPLKVKKEKY